MMISKRVAMFKLNPNALPFKYTDKHALFLTFSNGFPLTETQILRYFDWSYHPYVVSVEVHKPKCGPPLFGKIVFSRYIIPDFVMGNHEKVCFVVEGIPLYCRRFVSNKKTKTAATGSPSVADGGNHSGGDE